MGVRGLTTYITYNEDLFLRDYLLYETSLVIDGHSLCAQLYQRLACNSAFGGDYDKYAAFVRKFFLDIRKCKIECYILFDGSFERKKLRTAFSRLRSKINGVARLYPGNQSSITIFPLFLRDVFKEVVTDLGILYTVCEFEADDEIAALSRHLDCPVLSYDSDFFIYNVQYIPIKSMNFKPVVYENEGNRYNVIQCKLHRAEYFVENFEGFRKDLLPLLATLLGNDYIQKKVFKNFFAHLKLPKSHKKKNEQQRSIQAVIDWLKNETVDSAIMKIIGRLKKCQKKKVFNIVTKSCEGYSKTDCKSLQYFNLTGCTTDARKTIQIDTEDYMDADSDDGVNDKSDNSSSDDRSVTSSIEDVETLIQNEEEIPDWIAKRIRNCSICQPYINMYTHGIYFCIPQAENCEDQDCCLICLPIIRFAFDILTNFSKKLLIYVSREGRQFKKIFLKENESIDAPSINETSFCGSEIILETVHMPKYFAYFMNTKLQGVTWQAIDVAPANIRLLTISILWWVKFGKITYAHIYSVILCHIMLGIVDEKTGMPRNEFFFNKKNASKLKQIKSTKLESLQFEETDLFLNKNKVTYEDCLLAASVLVKSFEIETDLIKRTKTYDTNIIHSLAQFQCCLQQINYLNRLCDCKYDPTVIHKTYSGLFTYNILNKLSKQSEPMLFIETYLKGADTILLYFKSVCYLLEKCICSLNITVYKSINMSKRCRRKKKRKNMDFICEGFSSEVII